MAFPCRYDSLPLRALDEARLTLQLRQTGTALHLYGHAEVTGKKWLCYLSD